MRDSLAIGIALVLTSALLTTRARADDVDACATAAEHAQQLRRDGKLHAAKDELAVCVRDVCPAVVRADCSAWMLDVDAATPSIVFRAEGARGEAISDVRVFVDGALVATELTGRAIAIDPGAHALRYEHAGAPPIEERVVIAEAEKGRVRAIVFASGAPPSAPPPEPHAARRVPSAAWILGGAGALAITTGAVLWAKWLSERSDLASTCAPTHSCSEADIDHSRTKLVLGDIAVGAGLVAVGAALWIGLSAHGPSQDVAVRIVPGGAVVAFGRTL